MNAHDEDRIKQLLQQALPPIEGEPEPDRDLWPAILRRLDASPAAPMLLLVPWFDWALLAGLVGLAAVFPASIPVFLYYL
jgi:hypothetical protein